MKRIGYKTISARLKEVNAIIKCEKSDLKNADSDRERKAIEHGISRNIGYTSCLRDVLFALSVD